MAEVTTYTPTGGRIRTSRGQASMLQSGMNAQNRR